jgi:hypothetical protein
MHPSIRHPDQGIRVIVAVARIVRIQQGILLKLLANGIWIGDKRHKEWPEAACSELRGNS